MRNILRVLTVVDVLLLIAMVHISLWWKENHNEPGLAEMINIRALNRAILISGLLVVVMVFSLLIMRFKRKT